METSPTGTRRSRAINNLAIEWRLSLPSLGDRGRAEKRNCILSYPPPVAGEGQGRRLLVNC